jgi:Mn2+/Fe2+ NRAMP family transporter
MNNPYVLSADKIKPPPISLREKLRFLGPGFILSASIVGSGELIATTTLGARAGFVTLWIILVSCVVKVALQLEFGKHTILFGQTAMSAYNRFPGRRIGKAHWSVWTFFILMIVKFTQLGGIIGGVAIALNIAFPFMAITHWALIVAITVAILVYGGRYSIVERFSVFMILLFTIMTFSSLYFLRFTPFAFGWTEVMSGLTLELPAAAVAVAIGAFGITGVGGDEILHYTYWCMEKGYAAFTGPADGTREWEERAKGWIQVMKLDALVSMFVYTFMTAAFYLLGAAILHGSGDVPQGFGMIESLSAIYTETLGPWAKAAFLVGAIIVLYSTLFSALAAWTRQYADIFSIFGWFDFQDAKQRKKVIGMLAWIIPVGWLALFVFVQLPVVMVIFGGIVTSVILLFIIYGGLRFRYFETPSSFTPKMSDDAILWTSILVILAVAVYGLVQLA